MHESAFEGDASTVGASVFYPELRCINLQDAMCPLTLKLGLTFSLLITPVAFDSSWSRVELLHVWKGAGLAAMAYDLAKTRCRKQEMTTAFAGRHRRHNGLA